MSKFDRLARTPCTPSTCSDVARGAADPDHGCGGHEFECESPA